MYLVSAGTYYTVELIPSKYFIEIIKLFLSQTNLCLFSLTQYTIFYYGISPTIKGNWEILLKKKLLNKKSYCSHLHPLFRSSLGSGRISSAWVCTDQMSFQNVHT